MEEEKEPQGLGHSGAAGAHVVLWQYMDSQPFLASPSPTKVTTGPLFTLGELACGL